MVDEIEVDGIQSTNYNMLSHKGGNFERTEWVDRVFQFGNVPLSVKMQEWIYTWSGDKIYQIMKEVIGNVCADYRAAPDGTPVKELGPVTETNPYYYWFPHA